MFTEVMEHFGLKQPLRKAGYYDTEHHQKVVKELKNAAKTGTLITLSGIVGCGKTTVLQRVQSELEQEDGILVSQSLAVNKERVTLTTLMMALFFDLATDKDFKLPTQAERRERTLLEMIRKSGKTVVLFVDEAHDLCGKTLIELKRLIELVSNHGYRLSVVLAGHPKIKNELRRPQMEEIGARAIVMTLEGLQGEQRSYIEWLLGKCKKSKIQLDELFSPEAIDLLAERLSTPLQIEQYLNLALEEAYRVGQKPVTPEIINSILVKGLDDLEPRLIRHGYNAKALATLINIRPAEIRSFLCSQLPPGRTQEVKNQLLAVGVPL